MAESDLVFSDQTPQVQQDIDSLIWLGHIEDTFSFAGHTFTMRTLKGDEELATGVIIKMYNETFGQARAWAWAKIGLSLVAIDGDASFCPPIGPDQLEHANARFKFVTSRWYWPLAEVLYAHFLDLETRQLDAMRAAENLSDRGLMTSSPSVVTSTEPESSPESSTDSINNS